MVLSDRDLVGLNFLRLRYGVTGRQIHAWASRRSGGFPEPVAMTLVPQYPGDKRGTPLFDLESVDRWHESYDVDRLRGLHWATKRASMIELKKTV